MDNEPRSLREAREAMGLAPMDEVIKEIPPHVETEESEPEPEQPVRDTSMDIVLPKGSGILFLLSIVLPPLVYGFGSPSPNPPGYIAWAAIGGLASGMLAMVLGLCAMMFRVFVKYLGEQDPLPPTPGQLLGNPKFIKGVIVAISGAGYLFLKDLGIKMLSEDPKLFILCFVAYIAVTSLLIRLVDRYARSKYSRST